MIVPTRTPHTAQIDLVPQAVFRQPISAFNNRFPGYMHSGTDDFDHYEGYFFTYNNTLPAAILHYAGHPQGTSTLYLDGRITDVDTITRLIFEIINDLDVPRNALEWQRQDDPYL